MKQIYFEYALLLSEKIQFDLNKFKSLSILEDKLEYAASSLPVISDEGGGRIVFDLGNKVLKIARNHGNKFFDGIPQNKKEILLYKKLKDIDFSPELFAFDPNGEWSIFEKVKVFSPDQKNQLEKYFGLYDDELEKLFGWRADYEPDQVMYPEKYPDIANDIEENLDFYQGWRENPYIKKLFYAIEHGLNPEELIVRNHYGIASDGRLVLVDYGH